MANFDGEPLNAGGDNAEGGEKHGVTVTRDNLRGDRLNREAELFGDMRFHARVDVGEGADRAGNGAGGNFGFCRHKAGAAAGKFSIGLRQLEAKCHRLSVDAMAAANGWCHFVLDGAAFQGGEQGVHIGDQQVCRAGHLNRQAGVEHV